MRYSLEFVESALKEWRKLPLGIRDQLKGKLQERLDNPHVPASRLHSLPNCYKIKRPTVGYRLIYQLDAKLIVFTVVDVGKRDKALVYRAAAKSMRKRTHQNS